MGLSENLVEIKSQTEALLEFANEKTGASDVRLGDAIRTLASGFGGGGGNTSGIKTGYVSFDEVQSIYASGYRIGDLWDKKPKIFIMYIPKSTFDGFGQEVISNNHYSQIMLIDKTILEDFIPIKISASETLDYSAWTVFPLVSAYWQQFPPDNKYYPSGIFGLHIVTRNPTVWDMDDNGVTISRFGSAGNYLLNTTYKWIAIY